MKLEHLGKIIDIEPRQAAAENRIVRMLHKHSAGVRQNKLFVLTSSGRLGMTAFNAAIDRLVNEESVIARVTTNHERSFLLKLTPRGEQQAQQLEDVLAMQKGVVA
jgi:hypothetical protein